MKYILIALIGVLIIGGGLFYFLIPSTTTTNNTAVIVTLPSATTTKPVSTTTNTTTSTTTTPAVDSSKTVIGSSVNGHDITAYHYGIGPKEIIFVAGIHGGYAWNTSLVAYQLMDYLAANPASIPSNETITIIPELNPDGLITVIGKTGRFTAADVTANKATQVAGRYNAHTVDLNRNFACKWQTTSKWQNTTVSGGDTAFSEPESQAIRDYVAMHTPSAVVVWYSAAGGVYASSCEKGVPPETKALTELYATASDYPAYEVYDYYKITGDMVNWLASQDIPAISVLLTNHTDTDWTKNLNGIQAVLAHYAPIN